MSKVDFRKEWSALYNPPSKEVVLLDVPSMNYLMIDGQGDPNKSKQYQQAIEALYAVSYALKFMVKKGKQAVDYAVMPLEGLWWTINTEFSVEEKRSLYWTSMIMQPHFADKSLYQQAAEQVKKKKSPPALPKMRFEALHEGLSAQILHLGPYAKEKPTVEKLRSYIKQNGYVLNGRHHEIYLNTPNRTAPEKLKTIIRQPIRKK